MALPKHHIQWFEQLLHAAKNERLVLLDCVDSETKEQRSVIALINFPDEHEIEMVPIGHLTPMDNPYDAYLSPNSTQKIH